MTVRVVAGTGGWRGLMIGVCLIALAGCAARSARPPAAAKPPAPAAAPAASRLAAWPLAALATPGGDSVLLQDGSRAVAVLAAGTVAAADRAAQQLTAAAGWGPLFLVAEGRQPNAFSFYQAQAATVAVSLGMIGLLADDEGAWAALFGHEMAHFALRHREIRRERRETAAASGSLLGIGLAMIGVPFGGLVADAATTAVERGFDRDEERDADAAGVALMVAAGYDPDGAVRLQAKLHAAGNAGPLAFFSTHPGGDERLARMRELAETVRRQGPGALPMPPPVAAPKPVK